MKSKLNLSALACRRIAQLGMLATLTGVICTAAPIQWGLTVTNINNPITPLISTNSDKSLTIIAGGGDTYSAPDSFTFAYEVLNGDFDVKVRVINVDATDVFGQDSPKGALMVRSSLDPKAYNIQINALPASPSRRNGQIESIGRLDASIDSDDLPGRLQKYGGDTTENDYTTYPDLYLRIQRQGEKISTFFKTANDTDFPSGWASNPGTTNGWQILTVTKTGSLFGTNVYVGLSTVAHNSDITDTGKTVTVTYGDYGPTPVPASVPTAGGVAVPEANRPGAFPNTRVLAAHFDVKVSDDGLGYPGDVVQSAQGAPEKIIWNSGGFGSVSRDVIASIPAQSPGGFSFARYQAGAFDFLLSPRDPVASQEHLGPYSNPKRRRFGTGDTNVPASQAWIPSPNLGFVYADVHSNGAQWNDGSPAFNANAYVQLDGVATGRGYDMVGGHFRGAQFYTRTTKLVTGSPTDPASNLSNLQRCAIPISVFWFPYDQGWKAGYIDAPDADDQTLSHWKRGDGWGLHSGAAVAGLPMKGGLKLYNSPKDLFSWAQPGLGTLTFPNVNSTKDGMLFTIGNDEAGSTRGPSVNNAALADGSGWKIAVRDVEGAKSNPDTYATGSGSDPGNSFSFLYVPYTATRLIGGHILRNGTVEKGAGTFSVSRLATGRYAVTIPGKTDLDGALMLQAVGFTTNQPTVVETTVLSYQYGTITGTTKGWIVESRAFDATLRDSEFNLVFVDFNTPLSLQPDAPVALLGFGDAIRPSSYNSPGAERVVNVADGTNTTKYLNFDKLNTGFTVIPRAGETVATAIRLVSANDAPERDPASYLLEGSNDLKTFTKIATGTIPAFSARFSTNSVGFSNSAAYLAYRVTFPTVANATTANSMQVAEVQLLGAPTGVAQTLAFTPGPLSIAPATGGKVTITFSGVLQSATSVKGTWSDVAGQANPVTTKSPYTITPGSAAAFYRSVE
jgi:hypothetical protein